MKELKWWKEKDRIARIAAVIAVAGALYQLYVAGFGWSSEMSLRSTHLTVILLLAFLLYPLSKKRNRIAGAVDVAFLLSGLVAGAYVYLRWPTVAANAGMINRTDTIFGIIMVIVVLEAARRVVGTPLAIIAAVFLAYSFTSQFLPGLFGTKAYSLNYIMSVLYMSPDGIFGMPIGVSAQYIVLFVMFGSFLEATGGGKLFTDIAFALVGRAFGGPAKAAVVSSGLMGMISGSAAANVATVGTFTIPLMKRTGYSANRAAAIEACASTGGQFTPPVMGAAAFIIAGTLGISYGAVALAAVIPAILFYFYLYVNVDIVARETKIERLKPEEIPSVKKTLSERGHLAIPLFALIIMMAIGFSPGKSVFWSIILLLIVATCRKTTRLSLSDFLNALENGMKGTVAIACACAAAGIIGGVITLTGLALSFSSILVALAGTSVFMLLFLTMIASLILGMGLPTTACYIILSVLVAPAIIGLGGLPISVQFFIFFFGCVSTITPPVALAAYTAAGIAKANPMTTGYLAFRMGLIAFLIPFVAFYHPGLLMQGNIISIIVPTICVGLSIIGFSHALEGHGFKRHLVWWERILYFVSAAVIVVQLNWMLICVGVILLATALFIERTRGLKVISTPIQA